MILALKVRLPNASGQVTPLIHLGLYLTPENEVRDAVWSALDAGYRGFDSAQDYENEAATASAITSYLASSQNKHGLVREDIFYTSKLKDNGSYDEVKHSISESVRLAPGAYIDLFLLHVPFGGKNARHESWRALEDALDRGDIRAIGISNFGVGHIEELIASKPRHLPAVNQIEVHPFNTRRSIRDTCSKHNIVVQAYSPLVHGLKMDDPVIKELASHYGCTPAQLLIRWSVQNGMVPLPKSIKKNRIIENGSIDAFVITSEHMRRLDELNENLCTDWDPTDAE